MGRSGNQDNPRNRGPASEEQPGDLLGLRSTGSQLRSVAGSSVRICPAVADRGVLRLCHAAGRLPAVRRNGRACPLVRWQEPVDHDVPLVLGRLGQAAFLERCGRRVRHDLAERVSIGKTRCFMGFGAPRPGWHRVDRRRRSAVAAWPQVPDTRLPDRRRLEAAFMDWQGPNRKDLLAVLPDAGQRAFESAEVRVQRHVEGVPESDCQKSQPGDSRARPISHHAEDDGHTP